MKLTIPILIIVVIACIGVTSAQVVPWCGQQTLYFQHHKY